MLYNATSQFFLSFQLHRFFVRNNSHRQEKCLFSALETDLSLTRVQENFILEASNKKSQARPGILEIVIIFSGRRFHVEVPNLNVSF